MEDYGWTPNVSDYRREAWDIMKTARPWWGLTERESVDYWVALAEKIKVGNVIHAYNDACIEHW